MAKRQHLHRYERIKTNSGSIIYKCNLPGCPHYVPKLLATGRVSLCNRCEKPFVLDKHNMKLKRPHCDECTKRNPIFSSIKQLVEANEVAPSELEAKE